MEVYGGENVELGIRVSRAFHQVGLGLGLQRVNASWAWRNGALG